MVATILVLLQQAIVIFIGLLVYDASNLFWGVLVWLLCFPMIYLNYHTYKYIFKFGFINFITINADTSEIDVKVEDRWYNEDVKEK